MSLRPFRFAASDDALRRGGPAALTFALMLAACSPDTTTAPEAEAPARDAAQRPDAAETDPEDARAYFEANFSGRWGMSPGCEAEGMFTLSPDRIALYEIGCDVIELGREGEMSWARVQCVAEGQPQPDKTLSIRATGENEITVEDGHHDWIRRRCGEA